MELTDISMIVLGVYLIIASSIQLSQLAVLSSNSTVQAAMAMTSINLIIGVAVAAYGSYNMFSSKKGASLHGGMYMY